MADTDLSISDPSKIIDYISGQLVPAGPEEVESVQVFSRRLVEDFGYPKEHIRTRPQWRVRKAPSDEKKSYPVDMAVFNGLDHKEDELFLLVECKQKTRKQGATQLKLYMDMASAPLGVWFNGDEHLYLRKVLHADGTRSYEELPAIPRFGERLEDIGKYRRRDLVKPSDLRAVFRDLRNHLAGMTTGVTRDEPLAREIINILFCKIYDEQESGPGDLVRFRAGVNESAEDVQKRLIDLFDLVRSEYAEVFSEEDGIQLDANSCRYVVGELQNYAVSEADRDAIGDAFETFIGPALRGADGQFFTPRNVVDLIVRIAAPTPTDRIIDPACGSGGFLIGALDHVWAHLRADANRLGWSERELYRREQKAATENFRGIDKDAFLAKVTKAYMALVGDGRGGVFCANSLESPDNWPVAAKSKIRLRAFDVVVTNPPFGKKIKVTGEDILSQYSLARRWRSNPDTDELEMTGELHDTRPPQILFIERCLQLLKPGGRLAIVLPESIFGMPTHRHVVKHLKSVAKVRGVVSMPEPLFKTSGKGGTHTKVAVVFIENTPPKDGESWPVFMAEAKWCGHDSRGKPTLALNEDGTSELLDDVPLIADRLLEIFGSPTAFWKA